MYRYVYRFRVGKNNNHTVHMIARDNKEKKEMIDKIIRGNPDYPSFKDWRLVKREYISQFAYDQY